jgi:hypothetical protein
MTMGELRDQKPELYGVGGWLAFLCVSLLLFTPLAAIREIAGVLMDRTTGPTEKSFSIGFVIVALGFAVLAGTGLVRLWPRAVTIAKGYFFFSLGLGLLILLPLLLGEGSVPETIIGVQTTVVSTAWLAYLYRSERVRNTYGKNTPADAAEVFR